MSGQENGLTLGGLAERLEALERENTELRSKVATLEGSGTERDGVVGVLSGPRAPRAENNWAEDGGESQVPEVPEVPEGRMSRRRLFSRAGAAAAGLVVAGALTQRDIREAKAAQLKGEADISFAGAVEGTNNDPFGYGVYGQSTGGYGVFGKSTDKLGVYGQSTNSYGVYGNSGNSNGVYGNSTNSNGVYGKTGVATRGGVLGANSSVNGAGVLGQNNVSGGIGVKGQGNVIGVKGESTNGYGGHFSGAIAQVKLLPNSRLGRPTTGAHQQGELFLDRTAALFICTASGTPGTWRRVTTTAA